MQRFVILEPVLRPIFNEYRNFLWYSAPTPCMLLLPLELRQHPPRFYLQECIVPMQSQFAFADNIPEVAPAAMTSPDGYKGLYGFHKYWGKKPHEPLAYIIEQVTKPGQLVFDPFVGSGTAAREALLRGRRFIGFDINPVAIELTRLLINPPKHHLLKQAARIIERRAKPRILECYRLNDGTRFGTHYLWEGDQLQKVWDGNRGKTRVELEPTDHDLALFNSFTGYESRRVRPPKFFSNGRINANASMTLRDIFTGRAQCNIDILLDSFDECDPSIQPYLKLCLTAASGQMTNMVFAVTNRGKTTGQTSTKVEVGSWVIGYWRPDLHFEVNVWNCFERRMSKLLKATQHGDPLTEASVACGVNDVISHRATSWLASGDSRELIKHIPDNSIDLLITDPPHSDRIPYLELSELWNSILNVDSNFSREIVVSNAKERNKTDAQYAIDLGEFLAQVPRILNPTGLLVLLFNARDEADWSAFRISLKGSNSLTYIGHFPCIYSAGSVVQDNRDGSLKHDYGIVFSNSSCSVHGGHMESLLKNVPGWSNQMPTHLHGISR